MQELEVIESDKGPKEEYPTSNLQLAAALRAAGHKFIDIRKKMEDGKETERIEFVFATNDVKETLRRWMNNELRVCPRTLLNDAADLKNLVHSNKWKETGKPKGKRRRRKRKRKGKPQDGQSPEQAGTVDDLEATVAGGSDPES
jgi:hypothetical protein